MAKADARSPWSPLRHTIFRWLWIASVASNIGTWFQNVGASWLMTTLSASPAMVALVQAATSLPMFLLSLPGGAIADVLDRRRLLIFTQTWMTLAAFGLGIATAFNAATPWLLLFFTFLLGLGAAVNAPAWQASIPEMVPRQDLPAAVALGSVGFNIARAAGPALAGVVVATAGPAVTFLVNAGSFLGVVLVLVRWRRPRQETVLPAERILGAMTTGVRYVRHAPEVIAPIVRGSTFVLCGSSLWALLPLVARTELKSGPAGYGLLLGALGVGAVAGAFALPRLKGESSSDRVVAVATLAFAAATVALAFVREFWLLLLAMLLAGGAWLSLLSSLNVAVQTAVPSWVRARALSVYLLVFFGGLAGGSALWGAVAEHTSVPTALLAAAAGMVVGLLATMRYHLRSGEGLNLAPSRQWPAPIVAHDLEPERGPVLVTVEYRVDSEKAGEFAEAMRGVRRIRLRDGAMQWGLFADSADPSLQTEIFLVKSWVEHLRQHERVTVADRDVEEAARAFHLGPNRPLVRHLIAEPVRREG
ncbi:MAG TPA: MFS transporter [Thermoanaerobaculia bacterium]|jgi:MFS family permease|nr:MFS transporter [Thermoanaerobaculia bacterium]